MTWWQAISSFLRSAKVLSMGGGMTATGAYVSYADWTRFRRMTNRFSSGTILPPMAENIYETAYFPRLGLERILRRMFRSTFSNEYYLITGDVGTGKTRSVVEVIRSMMAEDGRQKLGAPVYVLANQGSSFAETLAAAVDFRFDEHVSFRFFAKLILRMQSMPRRDDGNRLMLVLNAIEKSAFLYMQQHGRPAVIVVDSVDWLRESNPSALDRLQEYLENKISCRRLYRWQDKAKVWADANIVKLVLIVNDAETETHLRKNAGAWSRLSTAVVVEDLRHNEALEFLQAPYLMEQERITVPGAAGDCRRTSTMETELADRIVQLVGGRILRLIAMKRDWYDGESLDNGILGGQ